MIDEARLEQTENGKFATFLVLSGECTLVVEEQERHLRAGHFVHCPAETNHVFVQPIEPIWPLFGE